MVLNHRPNPELKIDAAEVLRLFATGLNQKQVAIAMKIRPDVFSKRMSNSASLQLAHRQGMERKDVR